ncbi:MAG: class I SAM-dependent DNA methyltransferase [Acidimicrobiales bacterium]
MTDARLEPETLTDFISRWASSGAAERANYQLFLCELCDVLRVPRPEPSKADPSLNAYVFEHPVLFDDGFGHVTTKFIDLYNRGVFILEAKQGSDKEAQTDATGLKLPKKSRKGTAVRGTQGWDDAMLAARGQAELYAKALPLTEGWPPFLVIVDVGHSIELYADFSRSGKTYVAFPDALTHRIALEDIAKEDIRERLRLVWTDPLSLDPSKRSAKVTRKVAEQLADLAKSLERSGHKPETVAHFLMRCIFTMFAEDVGLLPKESFKTLLEGRRAKLDTFPDMIRSLWTAMDRGDFSPILERKVLRFNGQLFADATALPLTEAQLELLIEAAKSDWKAVEPAIFGTLLERALNPIERHKLGAHYTPRAYVERLVIPTIVDPLREEWSGVQAAAVTLAKANKLEEARQEVQDFLKRLCSVMVLDPACGSGNFLYVTLEHMKRLEGEVRDVLRGFGQKQEVFEGLGLTVDPHQLLGIELNPRAAAIAELVLWIGYLQWHFRTFGERTPAEPIIKAFHNIECRDAVLDYERTEPVFDANGQPVTRWDGRTTKKHPVTGDEVPDEAARTPVLRYINPRRADWPEANFVVGNPPFIGNKRMRLALGDGYVEALRKTWAEVPETVDFVMYWWQHAAEMTHAGKLSGFGFITTNSITQSFNRKVVQSALANGLNLAFAIPDHPWVDGEDGAAVRVAMTVGIARAAIGVLLLIEEESEGDADAAQVSFTTRTGLIHADLKVGANVAAAGALTANSNVSFMGVTLVGQGFVLEPGDPLITAEPEALRRYLVGNELNRKPKNRYVIDFFGMTEGEAQARFPASYQRVLDRVKPERDASGRPTYRINWWLFGEKRPAMRAALSGLHRYVAICRTAKHFVFQFVEGDVLVESKVVAIAVEDAYILGVLSSRIHVLWAIAKGSRHGVGNDLTYNNSLCFETFPFPACSESLTKRIRDAGERLDAHRKRQLSQHPTLTITDTYNVLETLRTGEALSEKEKLTHEQGLVSVLKQIHDDLDAAVLAAYGWPSSLSDDEVLERLVRLNAERAAEEARGVVRWLRPEFQKPDAERATQGTLDIEEPADEAVTPTKPKAKMPWPKTLPERAQAVKAALAAERTPVTAEQLAKTFLRARVEGVQELLETLVSLGQARELPGGRFIAPIAGHAGRLSPFTGEFGVEPLV